MKTKSNFKSKSKTKTKSKTKSWSKKYKKSINCKSPKGFSQRQYCKSKSKKSI